MPLDPAYADPYVMLGRLHEASGLTADALRDYDAFLAHAARSNPRYERARQRAAELRAGQ